MTVAAIQPIPTRYKGHHFRSRLEARWAVFFDALNIKWEYEPQGFELNCGSRYLPDFYLPQVENYAEIKPQLNYPHPHDKLKSFVETTGRPIILLEGSPDIKFYTYFKQGESGVFSDLLFVSNYHNYCSNEGRFYSCPGENDPLKEGIASREDLDAVYSARSARFEHGQSGAT